MSKSILFLVVCVAVLVSAIPMVAHHGSAGYDIAHPMTLTGTLRIVELVNPHSFIYFDVTTSSGSVESWALEGNPPRLLEARSGLTKNNLKPGTKLTVIGFPQREAYPNGNGTFNSLDQALSYSPRAVDALKSRHVLQVGEIRLESGEVRGFGMGPNFRDQR
jgi:hypothetical protein